MRRLLLALLCIAAFALWQLTAGAPRAAAQEPFVGEAPRELLDRIQSRYEALEGFRAEFDQVLINSVSKERDERAGVLSFEKPAFFRWETRDPEPELLIANEDVVWDYYPDEGVAYKYPVEDLLGSKTMLRFLAGQAELEEDFFITRLSDPETPGMVKLDLTPKEPEPSLVQAYIWVDPGDGLFRRITLVDFYGNENRLVFKSIAVNPTLPEAHFTFDPPADVEIFDNTIGSELLAPPDPGEAVQSQELRD